MGSNATVNFTNNSGLDLVIAFVQGAEGGQSAADVACILPYGFTAKPNGPVQRNTGCVVATIPPGADYPSGTGWSIGKVIVGGNTLQLGSNILCLLNSDTVVCTFPAFPSRQMHIDMTKTSGGNSALSFFENGQP